MVLQSCKGVAAVDAELGTQHFRFMRKGRGEGKVAELIRFHSV